MTFRFYESSHIEYVTANVLFVAGTGVKDLWCVCLIPLPWTFTCKHKILSFITIACGCATVLQPFHIMHAEGCEMQLKAHKKLVSVCSKLCHFHCLSTEMHS